MHNIIIDHMNVPSHNSWKQSFFKNSEVVVLLLSHIFSFGRFTLLIYYRRSHLHLHRSWAQNTAFLAVLWFSRVRVYWCRSQLTIGTGAGLTFFGLFCCEAKEKFFSFIHIWFWLWFFLFSLPRFHHLISFFALYFGYDSITDHILVFRVTIFPVFGLPNGLVFADSPILFLVLADGEAGFAFFGLVITFLFFGLESFGVI